MGERDELWWDSSTTNDQSNSSKEEGREKKVRFKWSDQDPIRSVNWKAEILSTENNCEFQEKQMN